MAGLDDVDQKVCAQIIYGVDMERMLSEAQRQAEQPIEGDAGAEAELKTFTSTAYAGKAKDAIEALKELQKGSQFPEARSGPSKGVHYYGALKSIESSLDGAPQPELFAKWIGFNSLPIFSNVMAWSSIERIVNKMVSGPLKSDTLVEFHVNLDKYLPQSKDNGFFRHLLSYLFAFFAFKENEQLLVEIGTEFTQTCLEKLSTMTFPKASQSNSTVDLLANTCIVLERPFGAYFQGYHICQRALKVSYQSIEVMRLWCLTAIHDRKSVEVVPAFKTYVAYVDDAKIKNGNNRIDSIDTIETYLELLGYVTDTWANPSRTEFVWVCDCLAELKIDVDSYFAVIGDSQNCYKPELCKYIASLWYRMGRIHESLCRVYAVTDENLDKRIDTASEYYKKAVDLLGPLKVQDPSYSKYYYRYALILAKKLDYTEAIKNLKYSLKLAPDDLTTLNVITLLYSAISENNDKPLGIAAEVLDRVRSDINTGTLTCSTVAEKASVIQLYITYVALVEASMDKYTALECLSDLFDLAYRVLGNFSVSESAQSQDVLAVPGQTNQPNLIRTVSSSRPTILNPGKSESALQQRKKQGMITKLRRKRSKKKSASKQRLNESLSTDNELRLMHELWLWTSKLFQRCDQLQDAKECIKEADALYKPTDRSFARMGQLLVHEDPKLALQQFEVSLDMNDTNNTEAVIGLAMLITTEDSVFIGEQDKLFAIGRCKNYLEELTTQYATYNVPEIYYYLSLVYRYFNDGQNEEDALWQIVKLEENRPVRTVQEIVEYQWD